MNDQIQNGVCNHVVLFLFLLSNSFHYEGKFPIVSLTFCLQRFLFHIQVFALSRWLLTSIPIEYYEFSRSIAWSIPYINLPWERVSRIGLYSEVWESAKFNFELPTLPNQIMEMDPSVNGKPLTAEEYMPFLKVRIVFSKSL